jgi:DNA-binding PadR family transcriptional regulator
MVTYSEERDRMLLSGRDYDVLIALSGQPLNGYEIARQCEVDSGSEHGSTSTGGIQYTLKGLLSYGYITKVDSAKSRSGYDYHVTSLGETAVESELRQLRRRVKQIEDRRRRNT